MVLATALIYGLMVAGTFAVPWPSATKTLASINQPGAPSPTSGHVHKRDAEETASTLSFPVSICGWIGGKPDMPAYCSTYSRCVWNSDNGYVGCCATAGTECRWYTECADEDHKPRGDKTDIYTCRGSAMCFRNTYPNGYFQWGCGNTEDATNVSTSITNFPLPLGVIITGTLHGSSSTPASSLSNSATATASPGSGSGGTNVGAIAGGTVGGVSGLALIGAIGFFFLRRQRKEPEQKAEQDDSTPREEVMSIQSPSAKTPPPFTPSPIPQSDYAAMELESPRFSAVPLATGPSELSTPDGVNRSTVVSINSDTEPLELAGDSTIVSRMGS